MKKKTIIIIISVLILIAIIGIIIFFNLPKVNNDIEKLNLDNYDNLMIVAHPDDEMLWGGVNLIEDNYLVVCITCGNDPIRNKEFTDVLNKTNDLNLMLKYPDKTNGERDDWSTSKSSIMNDLEKIINYKDWNKIVTHNPFGEYGHIHHIYTDNYVTYLTEDKDKLYYFETYYSKKKIGAVEDTLVDVDEELLKEKIDILKIYKSQNFIMTAFDQMFEHEELISYKDWYDAHE